MYQRDETNNMRLLTGQNLITTRAVFAIFFTHRKNFSLHIEVANNLPFAKFYIACIQTHYVHTLCDSDRGSVWPFENERIKLVCS